MQRQNQTTCMIYFRVGKQFLFFISNEQFCTKLNTTGDQKKNSSISITLHVDLVPYYKNIQHILSILHATRTRFPFKQHLTVSSSCHSIASIDSFSIEKKNVEFQHVEGILGNVLCETSVNTDQNHVSKLEYILCYFVAKHKRNSLNKSYLHSSVYSPITHC